jgi:MFS transporter, DHA1 family, multidrug resistance protein
MCRAPVLPLYARELGAAPQAIGLIVGASTLTGVLLKLPAGAISDAVGRRALLLGAGGVFALLPFTYPLAVSVALLVAVRFVHGSATALFGPTASAALSDLAPAHERGRWLGTYSAIQGSGQAAGPVVAGWILATYGFDAAFVTAGILGCSAWALIAMVSPGARKTEPMKLATLRTGIRDVVVNPRILWTSLAQASQFLLHGLIAAFLPIYAVEHVGLDATAAGVIFGVQMVTTILSRPVFGRLSDRVGRRPMIAVGLIGSAVAVGSLSMATSFAALLVVSALYGAGLAVTTSSTAALITDLTHHSRYGAAHGLFGTIFDVGDALGPIAGGIMVAVFGYARTFQTVAVLVIGLTGLFWLASRRWTISVDRWDE